jgi:integral membrane protein (TIGR01906 family)
MLVFNKDYYSAELSKLGVEDKAAAYEVMDYIQGKSDLPGQFSEKEKLHLLDVKNLINAALMVLYLSAILATILLFILYFTDKNFWGSFRKVFLFSSAGVILILLILLLLSNKFGFLFTKFHTLFFEEGSWLFSSASKLVNIFPQQFFYNFFYKTVFNSFLVSAVLFVFSIFLNKKTRNFLKKDVFTKITKKLEVKNGKKEKKSS